MFQGHRGVLLSYRNFKALKFRQTLYPSGKRWTVLGYRADTIQRLSAAFVLPGGSERPKGLTGKNLKFHVSRNAKRIAIFEGSHRPA
ncbi:MAG: hypothetical protein AB1352_00765 [Patescibacteria group bacterium]